MKISKILWNTAHRGVEKREILSPHHWKNFRQINYLVRQKCEGEFLQFTFLAKFRENNIFTQKKLLLIWRNIFLVRQNFTHSLSFAKFPWNHIACKWIVFMKVFSSNLFLHCVADFDNCYTMWNCGITINILSLTYLISFRGINYLVTSLDMVVSISSKYVRCFHEIFVKKVRE